MYLSSLMLLLTNETVFLFINIGIWINLRQPIGTSEFVVSFFLFVFFFNFISKISRAIRAEIFKTNKRSRNNIQCHVDYNVSLMGIKKLLTR